MWDIAQVRGTIRNDMVLLLIKESKVSLCKQLNEEGEVDSKSLLESSKRPSSCQ